MQFIELAYRNTIVLLNISFIKTVTFESIMSPEGEYMFQVILDTNAEFPENGIFWQDFSNYDEAWDYFNKIKKDIKG